MGKGWPRLSSNDPDQVSDWFNSKPEFKGRGICLHAGKSGAVVFDVDQPDNVPEWMQKELDKLPYFATSKSKMRRHYVALQPEGRLIGNSNGKLGDGWGEVRGLNGVIAVYPTKHPDERNPEGSKDPDDPGCYRIGRAGVVPPLPPALADKLVDATPENVQLCAPADVEEFFVACNDQTHKQALRGPLKKLQAAEVGTRYPSARDALCWAFREAYAGAYPARKAHDELSEIYRQKFEGVPGRTPPRDEWPSLVRMAVSAALASDPSKQIAKLDRDKAKTARPVLKFMSARELAAPVTPVEFYCNGAVVSDSYGPNAGPKKSLKTHLNHALAISLTSGLPLFGHPEFKVPKPVPVLYIVGEGGEKPIRRQLQRMARAYGVDLRDMPLLAAFGSADINSEDFMEAVRAGLDKIQPAVVLLESFYNFHPTEVDTKVLHQRGRLITEYFEGIRNECAGATPLLTDHFRSTNTSKTLDLDTIAMAGQAESADSWLLTMHRQEPDVPAGEFHMRTQFGGRQWGNRDWDIDWSLGKFDIELGEHIGDISWRVSPSESVKEERKRVTGADIEEELLEYISANPREKTKEQAVKDIVQALGVTDKRVRDAFDKLADGSQIKSQKLPHREGNRTVKRDVWEAGRVRKAGS